MLINVFLRFVFVRIFFGTSDVKVTIYFFFFFIIFLLIYLLKL